MKILKRLLIWTAIALILQNSLFLFLDKYYLKTDLNFTATKVEKKTTEIHKSVIIKFPEDIQNLSICFNGKYAAYMKDNNIYTVNMENNETQKVHISSECIPIFYKWLPDINRIIIVEKYPKDKKFRFSYYDVKTEETVAVNDFLNNQEVFMPIKSDSDYIDDIAISTKTQVMYVKVAKKGKRCSLYRIDRMSRIEPLKVNAYLLDDIFSTNHDDRLLYEDTINRRIGVSNMAPIKIKDVKEPALLGTDDNDCVYIGETNNGKVQKIYYGKLKDKLSQWKTYIPEEPIYKDEVFIKNDGSVFIDSSLKGSITEISNGNTVNYQGRFLRICNSSIYSIMNNELLITSLSQN